MSRASADRRSPRRLARGLTRRRLPIPPRTETPFWACFPEERRAWGLVPLHVRVEGQAGEFTVAPGSERDAPQARGSLEGAGAAGDLVGGGSDRDFDRPLAVRQGEVAPVRMGAREPYRSRCRWSQRPPSPRARRSHRSCKRTPSGRRTWATTRRRASATARSDPRTGAASGGDPRAEPGSPSFPLADASRASETSFVLPRARAFRSIHKNPLLRIGPKWLLL